jgi:hypothetical protein
VGDVARLAGSWFRACRRLIAIVLGLAGAGAVPSAPAAPPAAVAAALDEQATILRSRADALGIRGILRLALEAAGAGHDAAIVVDALFCARSMQDRDPASPWAGNFRWRLGDERVVDENAVEFAVQLLSLIALDHRARLTPESTRRLDELLADALPALRRHRVPLGQTNIALTRIWNLLALGLLGDAEARREGEEAWRSWLDFTRARGITEALCPTYYGVDLDALGLIATRAQADVVRGEARQVLAYLWTSIAAHWYAPSGRLSGPHARDTDWLFGRGLLDEHAAAAGWIPFPEAGDATEWLPGSRHAGLTVFRTACQRPPPPVVDRSRCSRVPRFVVERHGTHPWQRSTDHVGRLGSIGIAGETRGAEDKALVVNLGGGATTVNVTLVYDGHGDPYGRRRDVGADGHRKARHLRPFLVSSQDGPRVTAAWHLDPADPVHRLEGTERSIAAHLIVPADATVWDEAGPCASGAVLPADAVAFVEREGTVLALRSVVPTATERSPARWRLVDDGARHGARRLSAEPAGGGGLAALLVILDLELCEGLGAAGFAAFRREFAARGVTAERSADRLAVRGSLPLEADLVARRPLAFRPLLAEGALLLLDGAEVGRPLLAPATP